jgi:hypothetical protein
MLWCCSRPGCVSVWALCGMDSGAEQDGLPDGAAGALSRACSDSGKPPLPLNSGWLLLLLPGVLLRACCCCTAMRRPRGSAAAAAARLSPTDVGVLRLARG